MGAPSRSRGVGIAGIVLAVLVLRIAWFWGFVGSLLQDQGWNLRVAQRLAAGETLYVDVAWAYGPLPVEALALLLRLSPSAQWSHAIHAVLAAVALAASFLAIRPLVGRRTAGAVVAICASVGLPADLVTYHFIPYTSAVTWGSALSLVALAAVLRWRASGIAPWLLLASVAAALAVLSKPEFGLAAVGTVVAAALLRSPAWAGLATVSIAAVTLAGVVSTVGGTSWTDGLLAWRGYTGYDMVPRGAVLLHVSWKVLTGSVAVGVLALLAAGAQRWSPARRATAIALGVAVAGLVVSHRDSPDLLARGVAHAVGMTLFFVLLWLGWRARRGGASSVFWLLWVFSLLVNARFVLLASFCPMALAPLMALAIESFRSARVEAPRRPILVFVLLVTAFSIWMQIRFFRLAGDVGEIETTLGPIATTTRQAEIIRPIQDDVRSLPPGPLFVAGWAPGWYLVTGRPNETRFDLLLRGLGTTPPEALELACDLATSPPQVLLVDGGLAPSEQAVLEALVPDLEARYRRIDTPEPSLWKLYSRRAHRSVANAERGSCPKGGGQE